MAGGALGCTPFSSGLAVEGFGVAEGVREESTEDPDVTLVGWVGWVMSGVGTVTICRSIESVLLTLSHQDSSTCVCAHIRAGTMHITPPCLAMSVKHVYLYCETHQGL